MLLNYGGEQPKYDPDGIKCRIRMLIDCFGNTLDLCQPWQYRNDVMIGIFTDDNLKQLFVEYVKDQTGLTVNKIFAIKRGTRPDSGSIEYRYWLMAIDIEEDKHYTEYLLRK